MKGILYYKMEHWTQKLGPTFRRWGQGIYRAGVANQGTSGHEDYAVPSLRCVPISESKYPRLLDADWVAPNATVIGDVKLGEGASLWHGVIVRGDTATVSIGKNTTVQDCTRIASSKRAAGDTIKIGENVYIGANASLDACTLEDNAFVGMGSTVKRGARVQAFAVVSAGAVVEEGTVVPSGQIFAGAPAKYLRDLTQEEKHLMTEHKLEMQQLSHIYCEETELNFREIINRRDELIKYQRQDLHDRFVEELAAIGMPTTHDDFDYIEHRVYHDYVASIDYHVDNPAHNYKEWEQNWTPYEQDMTHYPEVFKRYQENYEKYDKKGEEFATENPLAEQGPDQFDRVLPKDMSPWEEKYSMLMPRYTGTSCQ